MRETPLQYEQLVQLYSSLEGILVSWSWDLRHMRMGSAVTEKRAIVRNDDFWNAMDREHLISFKSLITAAYEVSGDRGSTSILFEK